MYVQLAFCKVEQSKLKIRQRLGWTLQNIEYENYQSTLYIYSEDYKLELQSSTTTHPLKRLKLKVL